MFHKVVAVAVVLAGAGVARAETEKSIAASFTEGLSNETSGIHRLQAGAVFTAGPIGFDGGIEIQRWSRWQTDKGTDATGAGVGGDVRVEIMRRGRLRGLYATVGAAYVRFLDGSDKRVDDALGRADIGPNGFNARVGLGYGFPASAKTTIAVRLEVDYWRIEGGDFPPEATDEHPNPISIHLGLEFMRWM